jgi:hypothetical protein
MMACVMCETVSVQDDVFEAELGMCLDCSNAYWGHYDEDCSWSCMADFPNRMKKNARNG